MRRHRQPTDAPPEVDVASRQDQRSNEHDGDGDLIGLRHREHAHHGAERNRQARAGCREELVREPDRRRDTEHRERLREHLSLVEPDERIDRRQRGGDEAGAPSDGRSTGHADHDDRGGADDARHDLVFQPGAQAELRRTGEQDRPGRRMTRVGYAHVQRVDEPLTVGEEQRSEVIPEAVSSDGVVTRHHGVARRHGKGFLSGRRTASLERRGNGRLPVKARSRVNGRGRTDVLPRG